MGLLDSILGAVATNAGGTSNPILGALDSLLEKNGGMQGLSDKFSQGGLGDVFSSWVSTGQNLPINASQIQSVLGQEQIQALAGKIGIDPAKVSGLLAGNLPFIVDKLTPDGQLPTDPAAVKAGITSLLPALLKSLFEGKPPA